MDKEKFSRMIKWGIIGVTGTALNYFGNNIAIYLFNIEYYISAIPIAIISYVLGFNIYDWWSRRKEIKLDCYVDEWDDIIDKDRTKFVSCHHR